ncbi:PREDICTED: uncharacterized protein LOC105150032 isoform X1 [Acromyrmex echinatior]|uniref:uncharacterized protein LOC105150032 isoform X1 n=1 Tax=Acromyrmex echinatior TaxID=103372 RepID=UPI000580EA09|nr:PREDICTED: uncharacterized protein LOC105150032 isoform X1 [Acromyrmex echinatior]
MHRQRNTTGIDLYNDYKLIKRLNVLFIRTTLKVARQEKIEGCLRHLVRTGPSPSKHISGMLYNAKVKERWYGGGIVYADASLYQKFASVGVCEKGDDDIAALDKKMECQFYDAEYNRIN